MFKPLKVLSLVLGLLAIHPHVVANEIKWMHEVTPNELFHEDATVHGRIGGSLVITNAAGDVEILDTFTGAVTASYALGEGQRVSKVTSDPDSIVGVITLARENTTWTIVVMEGSDGFWSGDNLKPVVDELYPDTAKGAKARESDYLSAIGVNQTGDSLWVSSVYGKAILINRHYGAEIDAITNDAEIDPAFKNGPRTLFANGVESPLLCMNEDGTRFIQGLKNDDGKFESLMVLEHGRDDERAIPVRKFELPEPAGAVMVQCFTGSDGAFQAVIEVNLSQQMEIKDIPTRIQFTTDELYSKIEIQKLKSNNFRILYDEENEIRTVGRFIYFPDTTDLLSTPVARDMFIQLSEKENESFLSSLDYTRSILVPGFPRALIEYPMRSDKQRLFCVFGQKEADIYKSCYRADLK